MWPLLVAWIGIEVQPTAAQAPADSAAVIQAAVLYWIHEFGFSHPAPPIETACIDWPRHFFATPDGRESPRLTAAQAEAVAVLVEREAGFGRGEGCASRRGTDGRRPAVMQDNEGRHSVSFLVSAPFFESADSALMHTGMLADPLWGGGIVCRWTRSPGGASWVLDVCLRRWES